MTEAVVHRQVVYCLLPATRSAWRRLERMLEAQRRLHDAALGERIDSLTGVKAVDNLARRPRLLTHPALPAVDGS